jgi:hypothetical protein
MRGRNRSIYSNAQRLLLASSSLVAALAVVPQEAWAQSVWGGADGNYRSDTNWSPAVAPIVAGQSAVFDCAAAPPGRMISIRTATSAPPSRRFRAQASSSTAPPTPPTRLWSPAPPR